MKSMSGEYLVSHTIDHGYTPTVMQILKLTYIAQGFHLSLEETPFFPEEIYAWKFGPVVKELYKHLKTRKENDSYMIFKKNNEDLPLDEGHKRILHAVFNSYGNIDGWTLSELTHKQGSPWAVTYEKKPESIISKELIKSYFKMIVNQESFIILLSQQ